MSMQRTRLLTCLLAVLATLIDGCHGGSNESGSAVVSAAPTGLTEQNPSVVYGEGTAIIPDTVSDSGGAIARCSVSPELPAGLTMDPNTGTITGTPIAVANDTIYTVTCSNAAGSDSTRLEIEVKASVIAPESLGYPDSSVVYVTNQQIIPSAPITTGGEITQYSVSPALPAGLSLDPQTGVITGTPTAVTAAAVYTITGSNSVDSVQASLTIEVQTQVVAPSSLSYSDAAPVYIVGQPIVNNEPQSSGGEITQFSVSPALPAGLSINEQTGDITGTPTAAGASTVYTVTGSNSAGSVTAQVTIDVDTAVIGEWLPADALNQRRYEHTATLLPDGRVLVAGGGNASGTLASAELYDPATDTWTLTGSMTTARRFHTATLLPNGKVLVAGGFNPKLLSSAELYDPASGTWSPTGTMTTAREGQSAVLLANGKVLVTAGGSPTSELYDPGSGTWSASGTMSQAHAGATVSLLPDGQVLIAGGYSGGLRASAELYNPATETWFITGSMATARALATATVLATGQVLVAGGSPGGASAELYDPTRGVWSATGSMSTAQGEDTATLLPDGKVLVAGGSPGGTAAELYDPATGTWSLTGSLAAPRAFATATLLPDGPVLVVGGLKGGTFLSSAELFH